MSLVHSPKVTRGNMEDVKPLVHQRGQVKARVTALLKWVEQAEKDITRVSLPELRVYAKKLETLYSEYNVIHKEILSLFPSLKLDDQDEKFFEFETLHTDAVIRVECLIERLSKPPPTALAALPSTSAGQQPRVIVQQQPLKAPIPTFDGRYENWPRFKALFTDIIGRCTDSDAIKLHHLEKALSGAAAGIIDPKTLVENNYNHAWEILVERFENKRVIVDIHLTGLLTMKKMTKESHSELRDLILTCTRHVEGLKFQEQEINGTTALIITKLLTSCLDPVTRKQWERTLKHGELPQFETTLQFLKDQCCVLERCETDHPPPVKQSQDKMSSSTSNSNPSNVKIHSAVVTDEKSYSCEFCGENHVNFQCSDFRKLSVSERVAKVRESQACFNCLRRGHRSANCSSKGSCSKCSKRHHTLLHYEVQSDGSRPVSPQQSPLPQRKVEPVAVESASVPSTSQTSSNVCAQNTVAICTATLPSVMLITAVVDLIDRNGQPVSCRAFVDCGAQTCLLTNSMQEKLGLQSRPIECDLLGVANTRTNTDRLVNVNLRSKYNEYRTTLTCLVVPVITQPMPNTFVDTSKWDIPKGLHLADPSFFAPSNVDLLIGMCHFIPLWRSGRIIFNGRLPELHETELGWVVAGELNDPSSTLNNSQQVSAVTTKFPYKKTEQPPASTKQARVLFCRVPQQDPPDFTPSSTGNSCVLDSKPVPSHVVETPRPVISSATVFDDSCRKLSRIPVPTNQRNIPKRPGVMEMPSLPRRPGVSETPSRPMKQMTKKPRVPKAPFLPEKSGVSGTPSNPREVPPNLKLPKVHIRKLMTNVPKPGVPGTPTPPKKFEPMMYTLPEARCLDVAQPAGEYVRASAKFPK